MKKRSLRPVKIWEKYHKRILIAAVFLVIAGLIANTVIMHMRMVEMANRLMYLQDTSSVIQSNVGELHTDIERTLRKENSQLEEWTIEVTDTDFAAGTYHVRVDVVPKEYTDKTKLTIYFGTQEYALKKDGFHYVGELALPIQDDYSGNVTVLLTNSKSKKTEILQDYVGYHQSLRQVLTGEYGEETQYRNGRLSIAGNISFALSGGEVFGAEEFQSLRLVVKAEEEELYSEELITEELLAQEQTVLGEEKLGATQAVGGFSAVMAESLSETEQTVVSAGIVERASGEEELDLREEVGAGRSVRVYLQAVSTENYRFEYELFSAVTALAGDGFASAETYYTGEIRVYDKTGEAVL